MDLETLVQTAQANGASDLHVEAGLAPAIRIRGSLKTVGEPLPGRLILDMARGVAGEELWSQFVERRSLDISRNIRGVRCRINVLQSSRGVGMAIRLLASFQATLETLNLHPELRRFTTATSGLLLVTGATGSGKSSTLAALVHEMNLADSRHIITIESPIEYIFRPRRAYIRQREVGRDTPSFEQALIDSLREDPDVLMVGEMREPETIRLTLNASETGHLVLSTMHSSTCAEALQRIVAAFPAEIQNSVAGQLADSILGVVSQRLKYRPELNIRVPECEILVATHAVRNFIRNRDFFKIASSIETGAEHGMWTFQRYKNWLDTRKDWHTPGVNDEPVESEAAATPVSDALPSLPPRSDVQRKPTPAPPEKGGRIEIDPGEMEFGKILRPRRE